MSEIIDGRWYQDKLSALKAGGYAAERKIINASKWNEDTRKIIYDGFKKALTHQTICKLAGIADRTLRGWIERGEEDSEKELETEYARFYERINLAKAEGEKVLLSRIDDASRDKTVTDVYEEYEIVHKENGEIEEVLTKRKKKKRKIQGSWQAAAWRLAKWDPQTYGNDPKESTNEIQINIGFDEPEIAATS